MKRIFTGRIIGVIAIPVQAEGCTSHQTQQTPQLGPFDGSRQVNCRRLLRDLDVDGFRDRDVSLYETTADFRKNESPARPLGHSTSVDGEGNRFTFAVEHRKDGDPAGIESGNGCKS